MPTRCRRIGKICQPRTKILHRYRYRNPYLQICRYPSAGPIERTSGSPTMEPIPHTTRRHHQKPAVVRPHPCFYVRLPPTRKDSGACLTGLCSLLVTGRPHPGEHLFFSSCSFFSSSSFFIHLYPRFNSSFVSSLLFGLYYLPSSIP